MIPCGMHVCSRSGVAILRTAVHLLQAMLSPSVSRADSTWDEGSCTISGRSAGSLTVSWTQLVGESASSRYEVWCNCSRGGEDGAWSRGPTTHNTFATVSGLQPSTTYAFVVDDYNGESLIGWIECHGTTLAGNAHAIFVANKSLSILVTSQHP